MKPNIHDYDRNLEREIKNLKSSEILEHNKELILEFYRYNFSRDISKPRLMRQINSLKQAAKFLGKNFEEATARDFQDFVSHRKELGKAASTIDTDKEILKVFYKWLDNGKYLESVSWMRSGKKKSQKLPENLLTQED
ncbi:MAG: phage integrase N-terminal SAM-like domain-containing protein, partial [Candidatus Diapherotrites archaeon]|nr:phage integrase N-terminal SAM-like domain-containing protein [Candidatus Diapherotrites archaeon]